MIEWKKCTPPCKFCGYCNVCGKVHEENKDSWKRNFGEYFNNSHFWRKSLRNESEMMKKMSWIPKMRGRCSSVSSICVFCGICKECGKEVTSGEVHEENQSKKNKKIIKSFEISDNGRGK